MKVGETFPGIHPLMAMIQESLLPRLIDSFRHRYREEVRNLQSILREQVTPSGDLTEAVNSLFLHQAQAGVVRDDLHEIQRFQLLDPEHPSRAFYFVLNPRRADRHQGGGRNEPPEGWESLHGGCFLCGDNIIWQQRFHQMPMELDLPSGLFRLWGNPFPLGLRHLTVATAEHRPQQWVMADRPAETVEGLRRRLEDLLDLAFRLPRFLVFENGACAGASIEGHQHYQALYLSDRFFTSYESTMPAVARDAPLDSPREVLGAARDHRVGRVLVVGQARGGFSGNSEGACVQRIGPMRQLIQGILGHGEIENQHHQYIDATQGFPVRNGDVFRQQLPQSKPPDDLMDQRKAADLKPLEEPGTRA